jgi:hypothetical protein
VVIRETTVTSAFGEGKVPIAAVALDLLEPPATRERSAGRMLIEDWTPRRISRCGTLQYRRYPQRVLCARTEGSKKRRCNGIFLPTKERPEPSEVAHG